MESTAGARVTAKVEMRRMPKRFAEIKVPTSPAPHGDPAVR